MTRLETPVQSKIILSPPASISVCKAESLALAYCCARARITRAELNRVYSSRAGDALAAVDL